MACSNPHDEDGFIEDPRLTEYEEAQRPVLSKRELRELQYRPRKPQRVNGYSGTRGFEFQQGG
jgi:hypothetical protein